MREYYDLWDTVQRRAEAGRPREGARAPRVIHAADRYLLTRNVTRLFVQSRTIQQRLAMWPAAALDVLYPPAPQRGVPRATATADYVFMVSRLTALKRADLLVRALASPEPPGSAPSLPATGRSATGSERLAAELGLDGSRDVRRPHHRGGSCSRTWRRCRAVCFPPFQEDYGFVTVEAFASRKAVITCRDTGGPAELVEDGVNGFVCEPTPQSLAAALRRVTDDSRSPSGWARPRSRGVEAELGGHGAAADVVNCTQCFAYLSNTEGTEGTESLGS